MIHGESLRKKVLSLGADQAVVCKTEIIRFDPQFRDICRSNACGMYGKCWMCPPAIGPIEEMIRTAKGYENLLLFQTVDALEDEFDFEGMMAGGKRMDELIAALRGELLPTEQHAFLFVGAGGCRVCPQCAMIHNLPCPFPEKAVAGFEAYGIDVSDLAKQTHMKYNNGKNTVTFFGGVFWR